MLHPILRRVLGAWFVGLAVALAVPRKHYRAAFPPSSLPLRPVPVPVKSDNIQ